MVKLKVATLNAASVQSPLEMKVGGVNVPGAEAMFAEYRKKLEGFTGTVEQLIGEAVVKMIIQAVTTKAEGDGLDIGGPIMEYYAGRILEPPLTFCSERWLEKSRLISGCDRVAGKRPAIISRGFMTGNLEHSVKADLGFLLDPPFFDGTLKPLTHSKYPEFPVELEPFSKHLQVLFTATFDAVVHAIMARLPPAIKHREIGSAYVKLMVTKQDALVDLMHASDEDVWFAQEVDPEFIAAVEARGVYRAHFTAPAKQTAAVFYRTAALYFVAPIRSPACDERLAGCVVTVKPTAEATVEAVALWSTHCKSDGSNTLEVYAAIAESKAAAGCAVVGGDSNATRELRHKLDAQLAADGFGVTDAFNTVRRLREVIGVQWSKMAHDGKPTEEPKDLVAARGCKKLTTTKIDNTGQQRYDPDLIAPNITLPTDHFIVRATVEL